MIAMKTKYTAILLFLLVPFMALCQSTDNNPSKNSYQPLLEKTKKSNSDAVVILKNGKTVFTYSQQTDGELINTMSVTKPIVGLAIAYLVSQGTIDSLETPVAHFYPQWRQGLKKNITIRHLMDHSSGLQNVTDAREEIHPSPNILDLGLSASVVDSPGTDISYNNKAVNILPGIVKEATGKPIDEYLNDTLFEELGIENYDWKTDKAGNRFGMSGLKLQASDLAKLGQLVLQKGEWNDKQLIDQKWIDELISQAHPESKTLGLLWGRIPKDTKYVIDESQIKKLEKADLSQSMLKKVIALKGEYKSQGDVVESLWQQFDSKEDLLEFRKATLGQGLSPWRTSSSDQIIGYKGSGDFGQYLVIYPKNNVVGVRMVKPNEDYNYQSDNFASFPRMVYQLSSKN